MSLPTDFSSLDDVVSWLQSQGLHAFRRHWSLGDSVGVAASVSDHEGVTVLNRLVFIYLDQNRWSMMDLDDHSATRSTHFCSMAEAVRAARDRTQENAQTQTLKNQ